MPIRILPKDEQTQSESKWISKKKKPKSWITKKEKTKNWITKKKKPTQWITKKKKPTQWITKKPTTKSTLTGTDTTRGGGPDAGNIGHNKDLISRHQQRRKNKPEWIKRKQPERIYTPLRTKKAAEEIRGRGKKSPEGIKRQPVAVGGIAKIIGKKAVDWIKKNRKTIRKEVYSPEGKKKTKDMLDKLKKKYPDSQMFGPGKAAGGRAGYQSGGRTRLLEELGRVEAEPSNRNRRAEISRVHGELNRGYKSGGAVLKGKKVGIQIK